MNADRIAELLTAFGKDTPRATAEMLAVALGREHAPKGDLPDGLTIDGHYFVHAAACPCERIQAEGRRLGIDVIAPLRGPMG